MLAGFGALAPLTTLATGLPDPPAPAPSWLPVRAPPVAHLSPDGHLMLTPLDRLWPSRSALAERPPRHTLKPSRIQRWR